MTTSEVKRLFNILDTFYHFEMIAEDTTLEKLSKEMKHNPEDVISKLMDIIEDLY